MPNYGKLYWGQFLNGDHGKGAGDCHNYGSVSGCDEDCPALWNGECDVPTEVLNDIKNEITREEIIELREIYSKKI